MHDLLSEEDIADAISDDKDTIRSRAAGAIERIEETLGIKPSTKSEVEERQELIASEIDNLREIVSSDSATFEDKNYIQSGIKRMISFNMSIMEEIKKEVVSGGGSPRLYEVAATMTSSTAVCFNQLMNLQKLASAASSNKNDDDNGRAELTETTTRTVRMGPAEMQRFIESKGAVKI